MSTSEFEIVGADEFKRMVESLREKLRERFDKVAALEEASKIAEHLMNKGFKVEAVETEPGLPPIYRVELGKAVVYIIVYPPRYDLLAGEASKPASYILFGPPAEADSGKYVVLIYFTRHGKLGPAAYLYLGMLIEEFNIGVLFVNGTEDEVYEILVSLDKSGKYEPPDDEVVPL